MATIAISASGSEQASVNQTLVVSFVEVKRNDQILSRINVRALKFKEFYEWLRDAHISPPCERFFVISEAAGRRGKLKAVLITSWRPARSAIATTSCHESWVSMKCVTFYVLLFLSKRMDKKKK